MGVGQVGELSLIIIEKVVKIAVRIKPHYFEANFALASEHRTRPVSLYTFQIIWRDLAVTIIFMKFYSVRC